MPHKNSKPSFGIALAGGAALGAAHIGVVEVFLENNLPVTALVGTSSGSIAASLFAFNVETEAIRDRLGTFGWRQLASLTRPSLGGLKNDKLGGLLNEFLPTGARIEDAKVPLAIIAADIVSGQKVILKDGPLIPAILASCAIPGIFEPVELNGKLLVDGGVVENLPTESMYETFENLFDIGIAVNLYSNLQLQYPKRPHQVLMNTFEIMNFRQTQLAAKKADIVIAPDLSDIAMHQLSRTKDAYKRGRIAAEISLLAKGYI